MKLKNIFLCLVAAVVLQLILLPTCQAVGVEPLVIELDLRSGETGEFKFVLSGDQPQETVAISVMKPVQNFDGSVDYQKVTADAFAPLKWIKLSENRVKLSTDQEKTIAGTVSVPHGTSGSYCTVLMVEPVNETSESGVRLQFRYAVALYIRVNRPGLFPRAELADYGLTATAEKEPLIEATVGNSSNLDYLMYGEATLRNTAGQLVERVMLRSAGGNRKASNTTRMYPGSQVQYSGKVTKRLAPGEYTLTVFFRYAEHSQIVKTKKVRVNAGDFKFTEQFGVFSVDRNEIDLQLKPGQRKSEVLELTGETQNLTLILVNGEAPDQDYLYSPLDWIIVQGQRVIELQGQRKNRAILTFAVPTDVPHGSYHCDIVLQAYTIDKKLVGEERVPVAIYVGDQFKPAVEVKSIIGIPGDEGTLISMDLLNSGNIALTPEALIILTDANGKALGEIKFELPEGVKQVLPLTSQQLTAMVKKLTPGVYTARIQIYVDKNELLKVEKELRVESK